MLALFTLGLNRCEAPTAPPISEQWAAVAGFQAHVQMSSDLGDSTLTYEMDYVHHKDEADSFTLTAPESLAGISGTIAGTDTAQFVLQYNGTELDDIVPRQAGLTPADGLFFVVANLRNAEPAQQWQETINGTKTEVVRYEDGDNQTAHQVWLRTDNLQPVYAEAYADGQRVLTMQVTDYQPVQTAQPQE